MHDKAFNFQTLNPDTIIDGLFDLGMRVDSGLTPLNSYENRVYQFQDEDRPRSVVKFYRPERLPNRSSRNTSLPFSSSRMMFLLLRHYFSMTVLFISISASILPCSPA